MKILKTVITTVLFVLAVCLLAAGLLDGGFSDVLEKARMICYECIGIG